MRPSLLSLMLPFSCDPCRIKRSRWLALPTTSCWWMNSVITFKRTVFVRRLLKSRPATQCLLVLVQKLWPSSLRTSTLLCHRCCGFAGYISHFFLFLVVTVKLSPLLGALLSGILYKSRMKVVEDECEVVGGMFGKYSEKACSSVALSITNPHEPAQARTLAAAVGNRRRTSWTTARPRLASYWGGKYKCGKPEGGDVATSLRASI
jgi:hypothetical protein